MLARQQFSQKIPWRRVQLYWGDERCVPPDDPASNYGMARDAFIKHVPIAAANVHRMRGEDGPEEAARAYEAELRALAAHERPPSELPVFDLVLLGLGARRAHGLASSRAATRSRWRTGSASPPQAPDGSPRLTVTAPVINAARRVWFLVSGAEKAGMVAEVLEGLRVPHGRAGPGRRARCTARSRGCSTRPRPPSSAPAACEEEAFMSDTYDVLAADGTVWQYRADQFEQITEARTRGAARQAGRRRLAAARRARRGRRDAASQVGPQGGLPGDRRPARAGARDHGLHPRAAAAGRRGLKVV